MYTIGTDPEFFLQDSNRNIVSAIDILPPKEEAIKLATGATLYRDNVLAEFTIPPQAGFLEFQDKLGRSFKHAHDWLKDYWLLPQAAATLAQKQCNTLEAFVFGCREEYNAWKTDKNGMPEAVPPPFVQPGNTDRTGGGHVHIGNKLAIEQPINFVRWLDLCVGIPGVLIDIDHTSKKRKEMYGGAGYFRPTQYGLEYRTLSNYWLRAPHYMAAMWQGVTEVIRIMTSGHTLEESNMPSGEIIQRIINEHDKRGAMYVWVKHVQHIMSEQSVMKISGEMASKDRDFFTTWGLGRPGEMRSSRMTSGSVTWDIEKEAI